MNKKSEKNLPLYGIGPVIVFGQLLIAGGAIAISYKFKWDCYEYEMLNIPLKIIGILSVIFGLYLNYSAKHISNLFENVSENSLVGKHCIIRSDSFLGFAGKTEVSCKIVDVDDEWLRICYTEKKTNR